MNTLKEICMFIFKILDYIVKIIASFICDIFVGQIDYTADLREEEGDNTQRPTAKGIQDARKLIEWIIWGIVACLTVSLIINGNKIASQFCTNLGKEAAKFVYWAISN